MSLEEDLKLVNNSLAQLEQKLKDLDVQLKQLENDIKFAKIILEIDDLEID